MTPITIRILTVVGARPQFVKASAVTHALDASGADIEHVLVHTGQHYDRILSDVFFEELGIPAPDVELGVGSAAHGAQTGRMLAALEEVMAARMPDCVLVYGDTNSTLAGALAAVKLHLPVAHVEAGLRSFNRRMPEEINRVVTDHVSDILFAPTRDAVANLEREGISGSNVHDVGDVMYDVARLAGPRADARSGILCTLGLERGEYVVATLHRAENTDDADRLRAIAGALADVAVDRRVVLPLHPRTGARLRELDVDLGAVAVVDPLGYLDFTALVRGARLVATDSGGLQKEAFFHRVPCVTLRGETEWTELVAMGWNRLVSSGDRDEIARTLRASASAPARPPVGASPYGAGDAAQRIVAVLGETFRR